MMKKKLPRNKIGNIMVGFIGLVLAIGIIVGTGVSFNDIVHSITQTHISYLIIIVIVTFFVIFCTSIKWQLVLTDLMGTNHINKMYILYLAAIGIISNNIIPHIGNYGLKAASMKTHYNVSVVTSTFSVLIEQLFDLFVLMLFIVPSLLFFLHVISLQGALFFVVVSALSVWFLFMFNHTFVMKLIMKGYTILYALVKKIPFLKKKMVADVSAVNDALKLSRTTVTKLFLYSYIRYIFMIIRNYLVILSLHMDVSFGALLLAAPLVQAIILVGFIPGALGTLEAGWFSVLALLGVDRMHIGLFLVSVRVLLDVSLVVVAFIIYFAGAIIIRKEVPHE
ncbi:MAG: flippase-like domain-containing protein [Candidatus Omnitrophica bacterium]|nr:flippase-like domain-containing protein [Candidatus Omnitrophota bacterium]